MTIYPTSVFTTKTGNKITFYNLKEKECPHVVYKRIFTETPSLSTVYCGSDDCNIRNISETKKKGGI